MKQHRLTPVQKRVLAFMYSAEQNIAFETGHKRTEFVNGFVVRCQTLVWYFLKSHGYIHQPEPLLQRWELTPKGIVAIGGCDTSPTLYHVVGTSGICAFCKRKVAKNLEAA